MKNKQKAAESQAVNSQKVKKKHDVRKIVNGVIIVLLCMVLVGGVTGFFMFSSIISKVSAEQANLRDTIINSEPTSIFDENGKKIGEIGVESRENVTYDQIPQVTIDAFLAIEDSRFYAHNGFDLPRFISSAINNLKSGDFSQGGSTLTMQTIDNFIMKPQEEADQADGIYYTKFEQIEHKLQEIYLSWCLEDMMTKEEIITAYLNKINFGSTARGIQKGAQYYFSKDVEELNLSESAFLAGVINAPNNFNPYYEYVSGGRNYYEAAVQRRNDTLYQMLNHGYITQSEYELAKSTKLSFQIAGEPDSLADPYAAYIKQAVEEARRLTGDDPATTPMNIYTALNCDAQDQINDILNNEVIAMPANEYYQLGISVINNQTGEIVAIGPGFDNPDSSEYQDRAMVNRHQPGSSIKPLVSYALTFDKLGWCTSRVIEDKEVEIDGRTIRNADEKYHGKISLAVAIGQSYNTPAVQALNALIDKVGYASMIQYMKDLGFDEDVADSFNLQYSIGGSTMEATPTEMAAAYAAMANGGYYIEPHMVTKIEYKDGSKEVTNSAAKTEVMSPQAAYMISELLYQAVSGPSGTANYFMSLAFNGVGYPVYGKTGTSSWDDSLIDEVGGAMRDEWMINYTSEYTIATWSGFDAKINGVSYITESILYSNIPGRINRSILDIISSSPAKIANPGGISSYGGGLIKTEWLSSAKENNPMTTANTTNEAEDLQKAIEKAAALDISGYTDESVEALRKAYNAAKEVLNDSGASATEMQDALDDLNNAISNLKEKEEVSLNTSALETAINNANAYLDTSLYEAQKVNELNAAVAYGRNVLTNSNVSQSDIDSAAEKINTAIQNCIEHPIDKQNDHDDNH